MKREKYTKKIIVGRVFFIARSELIFIIKFGFSPLTLVVLCVFQRHFARIEREDGNEKWDSSASRLTERRPAKVKPIKGHLIDSFREAAS